MGFSKKFAVTLSAASFLLAGCGDSLWPSLEASDPSGGSSSSAPATVQPVNNTAPVAETEVQPVATNPVPQARTLPDENTGTFVGNKVSNMDGDLAKLQQGVNAIGSRVEQIQREAQVGSDQYHSLLGLITARLQRGTTPGNPILVDQWNQAQVQLEQVAETIPRMTKLSNEAAEQAAFGQYLLSAVQATYGLSGAVDADHERLQSLEDRVHQELVQVDRLMTDLSQDINRQNVYVNNERQNMTTLSLAIKNGELYGASLATRAFTQTENLARAASRSEQPHPGDRPLVIIRFDRPNVNYQQALYNAVSLALSRKPTATFDLVAISPQRGTSAQIALNSAAAKRNAEDVLRTLTDMGVPGSRVQLLATGDPNATNNEVRLYVR
ncbi:hypothetical protein [Aestuariispira insulae]|uniref:OmpA family protein n=1 Tax=Aestuariispira insulae TaxID=1461337 RepID=A0A3D9H6E8_9PROT|nr:hypothetical protein [Aestuariispira insulae]RED45042.1 hypothetical protein DFP90_11234 [Aestuariispira insulae]